MYILSILITLRVEMVPRTCEGKRPEKGGSQEKGTGVHLKCQPALPREAHRGKEPELLRPVPCGFMA